MSVGASDALRAAGWRSGVRLVQGGALVVITRTGGGRERAEMFSLFENV
jgi:hypothetical protein